MITMFLSKKANPKLCLENCKCYPFLVSAIKPIVWSYCLLPGKGFWAFKTTTLIRGIWEPVCTSDESSESKSKDMGSIELDRSFIDWIIYSCRKYSYFSTEFHLSDFLLRKAFMGYIYQFGHRGAMLIGLCPLNYNETTMQVAFHCLIFIYLKFISLSSCTAFLLYICSILISVADDYVGKKRPEFSQECVFSSIRWPSQELQPCSQATTPAKLQEF